MAGLGIALLLGIWLTSTLLRRLRRLRDATRDLERQGIEARLPVDEGYDEVSELARAFQSMRSRLARQEEARRTFVATASHELRTPLASLHGMLELIEEDLDIRASRPGGRPRAGRAGARTSSAPLPARHRPAGPQPPGRPGRAAERAARAVRAVPGRGSRVRAASDRARGPPGRATGHRGPAGCWRIPDRSRGS